jgi:hypothetical protein
VTAGNRGDFAGETVKEGTDVKGVDLGQVCRELDKGQVHNTAGAMPHHGRWQVADVSGANLLDHRGWTGKGNPIPVGADGRQTELNQRF